MGTNRNYLLGAFNMRISIILLCMYASAANTDEASRFIYQLCTQGFTTTTMPKSEADRFCECVTEDINGRLSDNQRGVLTNIKADLVKGRAPSSDRLIASGIRDLVVASQARCEQAFYPPSAPISVASGNLQLTLHCDFEAKVPEAFVHGRGMALLTKAEQRAVDQRIMKGIFDSEYANISYSIDGGPLRSERWEIDLTGEIVSPPSSAELIDRLRTASSLFISVERGAKKHSATFALAGRIPALWTPCSGISR